MVIIPKIKEIKRNWNNLELINLCSYMRRLLNERYLCQGDEYRFRMNELMML